MDKDSQFKKPGDMARRDHEMRRKQEEAQETGEETTELPYRPMSDFEEGGETHRIPIIPKKRLAWPRRLWQRIRGYTTQ